jgi:uncharacterized protein YjiS (DUF1127 family)
MPCAGPDHSCNTVLSIRSPLGEMGLGPPGSAKPAARPLWPIVRTWRLWREAIAHWRQRQALLELDQRLLNDIGRTRGQAAEEAKLSRTIGDLVAAKHPRASRPVWVAVRAATKRFALRRMRYAMREVSPAILEQIAVSKPEAAREIRTLRDR